MSAGARLAACIALATLVAWWAPPEGQLRQGLALFVLVGGLWVTQALPLAVTALAVPLLGVLMGLMPVRQALAPFAHPVIFLFLGGFALGAALSRHGIDRALAQGMLRLARGHRLTAVLLLGGLCAVMSMWMSNTATAAMMVPLALGLLHRDDGDPAQAAGPREQAFVLLVLAYSASIGGIATLVGSPPNAIVAAQLGIGFAQWMRLALPMALLLWPLMVLVLYGVLRPSLGGGAPGHRGTGTDRGSGLDGDRAAYPVGGCCCCLGEGSRSAKSWPRRAPAAIWRRPCWRALSKRRRRCWCWPWSCLWCC